MNDRINWTCTQGGPSQRRRGRGRVPAQRLWRAYQVGRAAHQQHQHDHRRRGGAVVDRPDEGRGGLVGGRERGPGGAEPAAAVVLAVPRLEHPRDEDVARPAKVREEKAHGRRVDLELAAVVGDHAGELGTVLGLGAGGLVDKGRPLGVVDVRREQHRVVGEPDEQRRAGDVHHRREQVRPRRRKEAHGCLGRAGRRSYTAQRCGLHLYTTRAIFLQLGCRQRRSGSAAASAVKESAWSSSTCQTISPSAVNPLATPTNR